MQNRVLTQYMDGDQVKNWKGTDAKKKISLKSLRILVADGTDIQIESPYKEPLRVYAEYSISIDTLIESLYYNELVLKSLKKKLSGKANVRVLTKKVSQEVLDSLVSADKFDLLIIAKQIKFDYQFNFIGMGEVNKELSKPIQLPDMYYTGQTVENKKYITPL